MLDAKHLDRSVWINKNTGEVLTIANEKGKYIGRTDKFDVENMSSAGMQKEVKKCGFEFIGWN